MFTGIIEEVGAVKVVEGGHLEIACKIILEDAKLGDSIAINGVDLTIARIEGDVLTFDCMPETYRRSNLGELTPGDAVNLERSVRAETRLSGHIVRGVTEAVGKIISLTREKDKYGGEAVIARFSAPPDILRHAVVKGPVTIDGISLTVIAKDAESLSVSLVTYTLEHTNLGRKQPGDTVNLESDIIARYVDELLQERG
ncbi:MAG: riboflavin synthase [Chloroflexi bacterium]|nr:riboflavin synthase [Chloroflexota bacterium]